jgi:superfamily II DNA/RNA helicase
MRGGKSQPHVSVQVLSIVRATRPDRQTLLFSATLPQRVKHLVREALTDEVSVTVGFAGAAHADVHQDVLLMPTADAKMQWLQARVPRLVDEGQVVVFVNSRAVVDGLVGLLEV